MRLDWDKAQYNQEEKVWSLVLREDEIRGVITAFNHGHDTIAIDLPENDGFYDKSLFPWQNLPCNSLDI